MATCEICGRYENDDTMEFCEVCGADGCTDCVVGRRCEDCGDFDEDDVDEVLDELTPPWAEQ